MTSETVPTADLLLEELPSTDLRQAMEHSGLKVRGFYGGSTSGSPSAFDAGTRDGRILVDHLEELEESGDGVVNPGDEAAPAQHNGDT